MDYSSLPLFSLMNRTMHYLSERQTVLAQNIANADTPEYLPRDVKKPDFSREMTQAMGRLAPMRTHAAHLEGAGQGAGMLAAARRANTYETNPNGNRVSIEEEVQKMSLNQAEYQQVTALYRKTAEMFKTAIGRPGGM